MHSFGKENRWQTPFGAVGIGTGAVLSRIPEGACACGAEGPMASIGPVGPRCQGLCRKVASLRSGGRRLAVRKTIEYQIGALPRTPFPAAREFPSRGNERYEEKNRGVLCLMYYSSIPPLVASATTRAIYEESVSRCFILPPLAGEVRRSRKGGGERSEPIRRMLIMPYDAASKSRNADFMFIARRAIPQPSA